MIPPRRCKSPGKFQELSLLRRLVLDNNCPPVAVRREQGICPIENRCSWTICQVNDNKTSVPGCARRRVVVLDSALPSLAPGSTHCLQTEWVPK